MYNQKSFPKFIVRTTDLSIIEYQGPLSEINSQIHFTSNNNLFDLVEPIHLTKQQFISSYITKPSDRSCIIIYRKQKPKQYFLLISSESVNDKQTILITKQLIVKGKNDVISASKEVPEDIVSNVSTLMSEARYSTIDENITKSLQIVGKYLNTDRSYLFEIDRKNKTITNTHEWTRTGISAQKDNLQNLPFDTFPWLLPKLLNGDIIQFDDIFMLPDEASKFRQELERENIKSIILVPIYKNEQISAFTGFDAVQSKNKWTNSAVAFLQLLGEIFVSTIEKLNILGSFQSTQDHYQLLFRTTKDGVSISNTKGNLIEWNKSFESLFGYSAAEIGYIDMKDLYWNPNEREEVIANLLKGDSDNNKKLNLTMKHKSGKKLLISVTITRHVNDEGMILFFSIIRDITQQEKEREILLQTKKIESLSLLTSSMAHDFKNILMGINGYAEIGIEEANNRFFKDLFSQIKNATDNASDLINQLYSYAGTEPVKDDIISINSILRSEYNILRMAIKKGSKISYELQEEELYCNLGKSQFKRIILNLVLNANEANNANDLRDNQIIIKTEKKYLTEKDFRSSNYDFFLLSDRFNKGKYAHISIYDQGIGIDPNNYSIIFDPFFSTKIDGRGLGLASVHGIVKQYGGAIAIKSVKNQGSRFCLCFPLTKE